MTAPSKKVSVVILITAILVSLIILLSNKDEEKNDNSLIQKNLSVNILADNKNNDSDNDGLQDWEEILWGTNPNNPDTDGDGTNDLDEIESNRNPNDGTANDQNYNFEERIIAEISSTQTNNQTLTGQVGTNFAKEYFTIRQNGELSEEEKLNLVNSLTERASNAVNFKKPFSIYDLKTFDSTIEKDKLLKYAQDTFDANVKFVQLIQISGPASDYDSLNRIMIDLSNRMMQMEVPSEIASEHLDMANNYNVIGQTMLGIKQDTSDPLFALFSLDQYQKSQAALNVNIEIMSTFFKQSGIISEGGILKFSTK